MFIQAALWDFWQRLSALPKAINASDIVDMLVVAFLLYHGIRLVRETRAIQLLKGIAAVLTLFFLAQAFSMITLRFIIRNILQWGIVALAIIFQPELRNILEQVGRSRISKFGRRGADYQAYALNAAKVIDVVAASAAYLAERKVGALIVLERETRLGDVIKTGTVIDAEPGVEMITNIFYPKSPLHDGAMIIRDGRLHAAGCYLPLSRNNEIGRELGTRHRAALGMSEESDALVLVVSEESGAVTVAADAKLHRSLSPDSLRRLLEEELIGPETPQPTVSKLPFWRKKQ